MLEVRKVGAEWCAFHPGGREVARSATKELLMAYVNSANVVEDKIARIVQPEPATTEEPAAMALTKITYRTRARSTGAATASGRMEGKSWGAMCVSHGVVTGPFGKGIEAEKLTSKPQDFCPECARIATGELPKVARNAELDELL